MYPQVFGKYVLERELSRGGMARVLLATLRGAGGFEKKLVVKQIRDELAVDEEFVRRFVEEAKTTVALSHPNIVPVYELGVELGTYYLAMELVVGVSVAELLADGALSPEEGAYIGVEVCRALDYAHRRMQVVHRDITPRNVMVDEEGQVKLIDFGIALLAKVNEGQQVFGSPGHMPPEQTAGDRVGPPADLFALGVLLMEAWSRKAPFRRKTAEEIDAALHAPHPRPSDADPRLLPLDDIMARTLSLDPAERPQTADELGRALRKFLSGVDLGDVERGLGERVRERRMVQERRRAAPDEPAARGKEPSHGEMVTKTFAAREEVHRWESERPGAPDEATGPSTRKLESTPPDRIETVATRPIETPVTPRTRSADGARRDPPRWGLWLGLAAAATVGVLAVRDAGRPPPAPAATSTTTATTAAPPATTTRALPPPATATTAAPPPSTAPAPSESAGPTETAAAHLALYGDPGTRAVVDGVPRGTCPISDLSVEPGSHDVRFVFDATGESNGKHVTLRPGDHVRVRADFTGATPTVTIQR